MNCFSCGAPVLPEPYMALWSDEPMVYVHCTSYPCNCGEKEIEIPKAHRLSQRVAEAIAHAPYRLAECQLGYLLRHLDLTWDTAAERFTGSLLSGKLSLEWPLRRAVTPESENLRPFAPPADTLFPMRPKVIAPMTFAYNGSDWHKEEDERAA